jgi:hypothetical protein
MATFQSLTTFSTENHGLLQFFRQILHAGFLPTLQLHLGNSAVKSEFLTIGTDYTSSTPCLTGGLSRPLKPIERERLAHLDRLKFFLATAPSTAGGTTMLRMPLQLPP